MRDARRKLFTAEALKRLESRQQIASLHRAFRMKTGEFKPKPRTAATIPITPIESLRSRVATFQKRGKCTEPFTVDDVLRRFGMHPRCYLTGRQLSWWNPRSYQLDHFVPRAKGGSADFSNLRICSPGANKMKDGHLFDDFIALCREIVEWNQ